MVNSALIFVASVVLAAPFIAYQTYRVAATGIAARRGLSPISLHRKTVWIWIALLVTALFLIEGQLRLTLPVREINPVVYYPHLALDALFFGLCVAVVVRYDGARARRIHRWMVYPILLIFSVISVTGVMLLKPYIDILR